MARAEKKREDERIESQELIQDAELAVTSARTLTEWANAPRQAMDDWNNGIESPAASLYASESAFKNGS